MDAQMKRDALAHIDKVREWYRTRTDEFLGMHVAMLSVTTAASPADRVLELFRNGIEQRDAAAYSMATLAMTCGAMMSIDVLGELGLDEAIESKRAAERN